MATTSKAKSSASANGSASSASAFGMNESWTQGANFFNDIMQNSASEAQNFQSQISGMFNDSFNKASKSSSNLSNSANEFAKLGKENIEAAAQCSSIVSDVFASANKEATKMANNLFSKNVELSKKLFTCRTLNDLLELQNDVFKTNFENVMADSAKLSENVFKSATKAAEPISEKMSEIPMKAFKAVSA